MRVLGVVCLVSGLAGMLQAEQLAPPVELLAGLESGQIWAQFWGGGDTGVNGLIVRGEGGPEAVIIHPGTQFWAQLSGGRQQSGGRQGQTSLGSSRSDLRGQRYAQVWIPTACTNINLRAPTEQDIMVPSPCPNPDMARLCATVLVSQAPRAAVQVAVWAVANDPPLARMGWYLRQQAAASEGQLSPQSILQSAAELLLAAGLEPANYRMFR